MTLNISLLQIKKENSQQICELKSIIKISAEHFILEAEKFLEVNIQYANLELTDKYLKKSASLKRTILPFPIPLLLTCESYCLS